MKPESVEGPAISNDMVLAALEELLSALHRSGERYETAVRHADVIRSLRERGHPYNEIIPMEKRPLIVESITECLNELAEASSRFRRAEARALYSEGLTMAEIADLFGVSRQRIAKLLPSSGDANESQG